MSPALRTPADASPSWRSYDADRPPRVGDRVRLRNFPSCIGEVAMVDRNGDPAVRWSGGRWLVPHFAATLEVQVS